MAKAKSQAKKTTKAAAKTTKATRKVAKARSAPAAKARKKAAAPRKAAAPVARPVRQSASKPAQPETNWTDAIKAALERRHQQPDYPGSGSNSWKQRPKH